MGIILFCNKKYLSKHFHFIILYLNRFLMLDVIKILWLSFFLQLIHLKLFFLVLLCYTYWYFFFQIYAFSLKPWTIWKHTFLVYRVITSVNYISCRGSHIIFVWLAIKRLFCNVTYDSGSHAEHFMGLMNGNNSRWRLWGL